MRLRFKSGTFVFEVSAGYPPPCSDDERDVHFHRTLSHCDRFPCQPSVRHIASWIIARLAACTDGDIESLNEGMFHNDGGEFAYRFKVADGNGQLVGRCGVIFYHESIEFAGFSKTPYEIKAVFMNMLLSAPLELRACKIHSRCAETNSSVCFGYDGRNLL